MTDAELLFLLAIVALLAFGLYAYRDSLARAADSVRRAPRRRRPRTQPMGGGPLLPSQAPGALGGAIHDWLQTGYYSPAYYWVGYWPMMGPFGGAGWGGIIGCGLLRAGSGMVGYTMRVPL